MEIQTSWVKPPKQVGGLDHLAVQAPCINIYGRMLPGITNVTDRARYYSFYPWIVWALEQKGHKYDDAFVEMCRRADILFTLIANRHAQLSGGDSVEHSGATIGSGNLAQQIVDIESGTSIKLSDHSHRKDEPTRYFKNKLGGLGQYYLGVLRELSIMDGSSGSGIKNTNQYGKVLAEAMDHSVDRGLFIKTLSEDLVSVKRLEDLYTFCPCQLGENPKELEILIDLFFVRGLFADTDMLPRRRTLQSILYLADDLNKIRQSIDLINFKGSTYSNALPNKQNWDLPERLQDNRIRWAVYQRNELLSLAIQGMFYVLLDAYEQSGLRFNSGAELCQWFIESSEVQMLGKEISLKSSVIDLLADTDDWLPDVSDWTDEWHEMQLGEDIVALCGPDKTTENRTNILHYSLCVLLALKARSETKGGYEDFVFPGQYFDHYPVNLRTFLTRFDDTWNKLSVKDWIFWLTYEWGVKNHLAVALRKLRGNSQSTFRIRPSDEGLELITVPPAVHTSPRFHQAVRILKDIGSLEKQDDIWTVSSLGKELKEIDDG